MKCIVVDDEMSARVIITKLCGSIPDLNLVEEFSNGIDAIKYLTKHKVDVIFLDIHMPNITGFDVIESLEHPPKIILTTSDSNFALDAFKYDCIIDYLVKPIELDRFRLSIDKLEKKYKSEHLKSSAARIEDIENENNLFVNVGRRLVKIRINDIDLIKSSGDYVIISCEKENYKVHSTLNNILNKLSSNLFLRVHRSYIINVNKIIDIEDNSLLIRKTVVPIGRTHRDELMKRLNLL
ncbi:MAG: DNA-binding response regulator [Bacteroidetes bacterium]|nr:MAG: DNA-binding response regulator [Bacteroidota bacterium]